jgi:hypothetical protein
VEITVTGGFYIDMFDLVYRGGHELHAFQQPEIAGAAETHLHTTIAAHVAKKTVLRESTGAIEIMAVQTVFKKYLSQIYII